MTENHGVMITGLVAGISFLFAARFLWLLVRGPSNGEVVLGQVRAELAATNGLLRQLVEQAKLTRRAAQRIEFDLGQIKANISPDDDDDDEEEDDEEDDEDDGDVYQGDYGGGG